MIDKSLSFLLAICLVLIIYLGYLDYSLSNKNEDLQLKNESFLKKLSECELKHKDCIQDLRLVDFNLFVKELENNETFSENNISFDDGTTKWVF
jgi:uncharacterized membrane protein YukC